MNKIVPIIVAGGVGSRLWPVSTPDFPKQFLPLKQGGAAFGNTIRRVDNADLFESSVIVCSDSHVLIVQKILGNMPAHIICEPVGRNTAPAFTVGTIAVQEMYDDDKIILILPADHYIPDIELFQRAVMDAMPMAIAGHIVTFGIYPEFANTQYGYIQKGDILKNNGYRVKKFTEKPDVGTAETYIKSGDYLWNAGIFMMRASVFVNEMKTYMPDVALYADKAYKHSVIQDNIMVLERDDFCQCPAISFDYAVMERTEKASVLSVDFQWQDLGGWDSVMEFDVDENSSQLKAI